MKSAIHHSIGYSKKDITIWERLSKTFAKDKYLYLMSIPGFVMLILFSYLPMYGIILAFKRYNPGVGIIRSEWVGLYYFKAFINDIFAWRIFRNTFLLGLYGLLWGFPAPIILALLLNEVKVNWFKRGIQTITYLPYFVSVVILVGIMKELLSPVTGILNSFLVNLGIADQGVNFFAQSKWFRTLYIASDIWTGMGFGAIIYLAALAGIDVELYEAAIIDGANRRQRIWHISIPGILPTVTIMFIMAVGGLMGAGSLQKILLMYNPQTYETADVISTYVYRAGIENANYSYATAVGLMTSVIGFIFTVTANYISKALSETSLW